MNQASEFAFPLIKGSFAEQITVKEIALKTITPVAVALLAAAMLPCIAGRSAAADPAVVASVAAASAAGQATERAADPKREAAKLLARARKAIDEGDWDSADSFVAQAEGMNVSYSKFHVGDTPAKVRKDLDRQRPAGQRAGGAKSAARNATSQIPPARQTMSSGDAAAAVQGRHPFENIPPAGAAGKAPTQTVAARGAGDQSFPPEAETFPPVAPRRGGTPFDSYDAGGAAPAAERNVAPRVAGAPVVDESRPGLPARGPAAAQTAAMNRPATPESRAASDQLIVQARLALAVGDAAQAARLAAQAKRLGATYGVHDDSPAKVESAIQQFNEIAQLRGNKESEAYRRRYADLMMAQAESLMAWKEFDQAERLAADVSRMRVVYGPFDAKPDDLLKRVASARRSTGHFRDSAVAPASMNASQPANGAPLDMPPTTNAPEIRQLPDVAAMASDTGAPSVGRRALYEPDRDTTQNMAVGAQLPTGAAARRTDLLRLPNPGATAGRRVSGETEIEIRSEDVASPVPSTDETPLPAQVERVPVPPQDGSSGALLSKAANEQQVLMRKVAADLSAQYSEAKRLLASDPKQSLEVLQKARAMIEKSGLDSSKRDQFLRGCDRRITDTEQYIQTNRPRIELKARNDEIKGDIERDQKMKLEMQQKLAKLVEEFNKLMDEQRWDEAELMAKKAKELAPHEAVVEQLRLRAQQARRAAITTDVEGLKERGFVDAMTSIDYSSIPFDDRYPYQFGKDAKQWKDFSGTRADILRRTSRNRRSEKEIQIEQSLKTPVALKFQDTPLSEVTDYLAKLANVNVYLDPRGLAAEGVDTQTLVTINLDTPIMLKSALQLILEPLRLSYVVKNEVLTITSEQLRNGEVETRVYSVADLVVPIPNFTPDNNLGLTGALSAAQANARASMVGGMFTGNAPLAVASATGANTSAMIDPKVMASISAAGSMSSGPTASVSGGPGGLAGGTGYDFDSLIDLVQQTIQPESWDSNGGPGTVQRFQNNLSLVISQTQDAHAEIADLLAQLRRLQDLQVTIEVRFITLNDNFFERIGVDFDFMLQDYAPASLVGAGNVGTLSQGAALSSYDPQLTQRTSATVGIGSAGQPGPYTDDLNIPFLQDSFTSTVPQFGGYAAGSGATLGFAILSDIEAYFFIEAVQGDNRSNVLQAPKVTLFNGQQAFVSDTSQSPFVISVIPVVGDFAAAQQPVIVVLNKGTMLTVQAVVSEDRRFVRLTIVPFFSDIGQVNTFTFNGSSTSTNNSQSTGPKDNTTARQDDVTTTTEGTTVQLPTFSFVSVSTTVSVPDGGTVLLGGVKRLSEGRNEFGVPILNKLPYVNRLFKNVGIGRQSESLMMMVTPRIIIQEEEEYNLTGQMPGTP